MRPDNLASQYLFKKIIKISVYLKVGLGVSILGYAGASLSKMNPTSVSSVNLLRYYIWFFTKCQ